MFTAKVALTAIQGELTLGCTYSAVQYLGSITVFQAVQTELYACLEPYSDRRTEAGHAGVVRNGYQPERESQTGIGPVTVKIPKVRAKTGAPVTFQSALVPPYVRNTQSLEAALPWKFWWGL